MIRRVPKAKKPGSGVRGKGRIENLTNMGKGRPKGSVNVVTKEVKENIADCFERIGGIQFFAAWAQRNPTEFYKLYGKLLPIQLQGAGSKGEFTIILSKDEANL